MLRRFTGIRPAPATSLTSRFSFLTFPASTDKHSYPSLFLNPATLNPKIPTPKISNASA